MDHKNLRPDALHANALSRFAIGLAIPSSGRLLKGVLLKVSSYGLDARAEIRATVCFKLDEALIGRLQKLLFGSAGGSIEMLGELRAELAEAEVEAIDRLTAEAAVPPSKILVVGVDDPGLWCAVQPAACYLSLCDAARVAESTGLNVVDALPARDLAQGGQGGPIGALAQWVLLGDERENRLLIDLGRTTRMCLLPNRACPMATSRILSFEVGPGTHLLDQLAAKLTCGKETFDPGGRLAVQGQRIEPLLNHWLAESIFSQPLPRWHPRGVRPERFLNDALRMAVESDWSVRDLLCTATHLIAESTARAARQRLSDNLPIHRLIMTGGGQHNGMLLRELSARLPGITMSRISESGIGDDALEPACAAILALFHLDQVPGNLSSVTGTEVPRVLGRLTPGSPQSWQHLLHHLSAARPAMRPLRSAL